MPETSIIIRALNEEKYIGNLLSALQKQTYQDYEIILVDSGSTDRTLEIAKQFPVTVVSIESQDFTFGYALNTGCKKSRGKYLVFVSAHILPTDEYWLAHLVAPFSNERVAMVYGRQRGDEGAKFSEKMDLERLFADMPVNTKVIPDYANNANAALRRRVWEEKPFDEYLFGLEDIEMARYITGKGDITHYEPRAAVYHIHREKWHQVFNRYRREAIAAFRIGLPHPPQARVAWHALLYNLIFDFLHSLPDISHARLEEILRFRYYQWKGTRQGWFKDRGLDFDREKFGIFYPATNEAVVIWDKQQASVEKISLPSMKPGDILVQVAYVGVCRTDLEVYEGTLDYYKRGMAHYPIVPGHEFSGTIVKIGANNKYRERFSVGQRVVGECILSRNASNRREVGVINHNGAYAQFVVVPGSAIHKIPDNVDMKTSVLTEPLAVVLRALRRLRTRLSATSTVAIIGAGPIGNFCAQVLSREGYTVSLFDSSEDRLKLLAQTVEKVSTSLSGLQAFDVIIEATGSRHVLEQVLRESRLDSTLLLLGFPYGDIHYNFEDLVGNEKVIIGSVGAESEDFAKALEILPTLDTTPFTKTVLPLKNYQQAWDTQKDATYMKILLQP